MSKLRLHKKYTPEELRKLADSPPGVTVIREGWEGGILECLFFLYLVGAIIYGVFHGFC